MMRRFYFAMLALLGSSWTAAHAQVVINEVVYDISGTGAEVREFVELYNSGSTTVDIGNWTLTSTTMNNGTEFFTDTIPGGTMLAAGDYWVLGTAANVPNVDQDLATVAEPGLWPDEHTLLELKDNSAALVDALAWERNKGGTGVYTPERLAEVGQSGWWGNTQSYDNSFERISLGRFIDGLDTDQNGRDFGVTPLTPGAPSGLTPNANYSIPDVDALNPFDPVPGTYASFVRAQVIDPTSADATVHETAIPASPQGGNAIIAWDPSGGGNSVYSHDLVTKFDIYAYIDTDHYGTPGTTQVPGAETTAYGIGTTGPLHNFPDPTDLLGPFGFGDANGNTGLNWIYQKEDSTSLNRLLLVDANDGGPNNPVAADWTVLEDIEMSTMPSGWYRLAIDYDPATGDITAIFDDQTFEHSTVTDLTGTFFVGYRESLAGTPAILRPPTFDLFVPPAEGLLGDFNEDGKVDAADYVVWRKNETANNPLPNDDGSGTQSERYALWQTNFGNMEMAGGGSGAGAVPEPGTFALTAIGLLLAGASRRRTRPE